MKKPVTITLESDLLERIDEEKGLTSRSLYIQTLILRTLGYEGDVEEVETFYA